MIGKLERVALREVWKHEAYDFTQWLQDNIDILNDSLDLTLSAAEREQSAGTFSVDLVAEDDSGSPVIIENQLEKSDHDHLGKLITYLVGVDAKAAIWIVADPRPEHVSAIGWLNESSAADFYLFKLEAVKIGDSPPAPLLTLIVGPSEESREVGRTKKEIAERYVIRRKFWTALLDYARTQTKLHANIAPSQSSWVGTSAGRQGLAFNYVIRQHDAQVELYIDRGKGRSEENLEIFESLAGNKDEVESAFGEPLDWQSLEGRQACRIRKVLAIGGYRDDERWDQLQEAMVDAMVRLEEALRPYIGKLAV